MFIDEGLGGIWDVWWEFCMVNIGYWVGRAVGLVLYI